MARSGAVAIARSPSELLTCRVRRVDAAWVTNLCAVVECLLAASYTEHEIIDYLERSYGLTTQDAVTAVQSVAGGHAPIERSRSQL